MISDKGEKMLERLDERQDDLDNITGNLSAKEAATLSELLDKIRGSNSNMHSIGIDNNSFASCLELFYILD